MFFNEKITLNSKISSGKKFDSGVLLFKTVVSVVKTSVEMKSITGLESTQ
jgi:hypothetical protein